MLKVLDRPLLDLTTTNGKGFLAFLSALAQDERERIVAGIAKGDSCRAVARDMAVHHTTISRLR